MYLNRVILVGNLTRDPDLKALPSGTMVTNIGLATNRTWKDKNGEKKEEVEFHNLVAFGKTADTIHQWVHKGDQILIEGRLKTSNWEKDGIKHYKTETIVESFQFGTHKGQNKAKTGGKEEVGEKVVYPTDDAPEANSGEIDPADIPF